MSRTKLPAKTQARLLVECRRRCAICLGLDRDFAIKRGQIAHLDQDNSNASEDNLVFLCLPHHDEYDSKTSQSKGLTQDEVRRYRDELRAEVEKRWADGRLDAPVPRQAGRRGTLVVLGGALAGLGWLVKGVFTSPAVPEPGATWQPAPSAPASGGAPTVVVREIQPSGDGQVILRNINAVGGIGEEKGVGGSVTIAGADNGTASVTLENVAVIGGKGTVRGGDVTLRAGKGGPTGPGGPVRATGGSVAGGDAPPAAVVNNNGTVVGQQIGNNNSQSVTVPTAGSR